MSMRVMPFVVAALLGVAAAGLVACGSSGGDRRHLIPQGSADRLKSALSDVRTAVDNHNCDAAQRAVTRARGVLVNFPASVDDRLVARLRQGIDNLGTVAPRECRQTTQTTTTTTTPPDTTPAKTTPTDTTPTDTTPTDTTTTTTTPPDTTTSTTPPDTTTTTPPAAQPSGGATTP
jgi:cell division septation protein DedD